VTSRTPIDWRGANSCSREITFWKFWEFGIWDLFGIPDLIPRHFSGNFRSHPWSQLVFGTEIWDARELFFWNSVSPRVRWVGGWNFPNAPGLHLCVYPPNFVAKFGSFPWHVTLECDEKNSDICDICRLWHVSCSFCIVHLLHLGASRCSRLCILLVLDGASFLPGGSIQVFSNSVVFLFSDEHWCIHPSGLR
jgi:hypothetical protein